MFVTGHNGPPDGDPAAATASIRDVASAAGVSYQTVSRVINNHPNVSEKARQKVNDAIALLGYRPSRAARALASGVDRAVTVLTSNNSLFGYAETLGGIEEAARAAGIQVAIRVLESDRADDVAAAVEGVSDPRSGAVIVLAFDRAGARALRALPANVRSSAAAESYLGRRAPAADRDRWAWFDDTIAAEQATVHLLELGHKTVHHIAIPSTTNVGDRQRGWKRALVSAGAPVPEVIHPHGWGTAGAHQEALRLLRDPAVTAVLCGNDDQALGVIRAAHDLGLRIPADVSVVGFDDVPAAGFYTPALTTVRFDFAGLGRRAFDLLMNSQAPEPAPLEKPALVVRESTGPAPLRRTGKTTSDKDDR
ncbi:LacI family DNA-binding transcriptional regulator [Kribbella sp. NPDC023855]|uniref:LacI family DNA-binding transcriptional regulator n=1 Tax=Kribbella sp. NPDC023855 TaxID=3154698 RepID=UPI0033DC22FA